MMSTQTYFLDYIILAYGLFICLSYICLGAISAYQLWYYKRSNSFIDYNVLLSSPVAPGISIIAPAYNESASIIENINALLAIHYNKFEVIVINDGSTDDSLEKVIQAFQLAKVQMSVNEQLVTKPIRGIYKSTNKAFRSLTIVDKINGGKADALNVGINISEYNYFVAIDVDSVIVPDALLKLAKPFLDAGEKRIIATGGAIRIANSCKIENGNIIEIEVPSNFLARFQVIEYTRAFLMGRIAWSKLNGLLLISGALGLFDKEIAINCGGYNHNTVGEDMELVVRMRRYMYEHKQPHKVEYIPDPLCWTEVPTSAKILGRQRNRWTRGTMDTLLIHRKLFFNPKYGTLGMLGYPFWFFFEWLAPIFEVLGITYTIYLAYFGLMNWSFFLFLLTFVYLFTVTFSCYAILYEEFTFHKYKKLSHIVKLFLTTLIESFTYHPLTVFWAIRGNIDFLRGKKTWGEQERKGFRQEVKEKKQEVA